MNRSTTTLFFVIFGAALAANLVSLYVAAQVAKQQLSQETTGLQSSLTGLLGKL
jgi:hypothetical protein